MKKLKLFEIRDRATFIPCFAIECVADPSWSNEEYFLLRRAGYGSEQSCILFGRLDGGGTNCDPYDWGQNPRTMRVAHDHIAANFHKLDTGAVIDVEFILNETDSIKKSERLA